MMNNKQDKEWEEEIVRIVYSWIRNTPEGDESVLRSEIHNLLQQKEQEVRKDERERIKEIIVDADAPYTTECCRKTANYYKEQTLQALNRKDYEQ